MKKIIFPVIVLIAICVISGVCLVFQICYPLKYQSEIIQTAQKYHLDPALVAAVIKTESSFDHNKVSAKNAVGLMQVLPSTAQYITNQDDLNLFDPAINIEVGCRYLAYLIKKFDDVTTALFAYNAGEGNVSRWLAESQTQVLTVCPFPETNQYVKKIQKAIKFYRRRLS